MTWESPIGLFQNGSVTDPFGCLFKDRVGIIEYNFSFLRSVTCARFDSQLTIGY